MPFHPPLVGVEKAQPSQLKAGSHREGSNKVARGQNEFTQQPKGCEVLKKTTRGKEKKMILKERTGMRWPSTT